METSLAECLLTNMYSFTSSVKSHFKVANCFHLAAALANSLEISHFVCGSSVVEGLLYSVQLILSQLVIGFPVHPNTF